MMQTVQDDLYGRRMPMPMPFGQGQADPFYIKNLYIAPQTQKQSDLIEV